MAEFNRNEIEPILLKHNFKIKEIVNSGKVFYNKGYSLLVKFDYGNLRYYYGNVGVQPQTNDFKYFKNFVFFCNLGYTDREFLKRNIVGSEMDMRYFLENLSSLEEDMKKEIKDTENSINLSVSVWGEKANIKKRTKTKKRLEEILDMFNDFQI